MDTNKRGHIESKIGKVKAYQDINEEIKNNKALRNRKPTPEPQDFEEIEY
ncbi:hypothetical protein PY093_11555 [Cytobacillus sp. S13-E01]|nr:hypothetical protein [Cytobacillus sp. S13-E01]MDF0727321.1 hypothetical protein [Cytobacillus sp. S13-E01]